MSSSFEEMLTADIKAIIAPFFSSKVVKNASD